MLDNSVWQFEIPVCTDLLPLHGDYGWLGQVQEPLHDVWILSCFSTECKSYHAQSSIYVDQLSSFRQHKTFSGLMYDVHVMIFILYLIQGELDNVLLLLENTSHFCH